MYRILLFLIIAPFFLPSSSFGAIVLASGAGYRAIVDELADVYEKNTGNKIERIYGNMARVITQAKVGGTVDLILGDADFLEKAKLSMAETVEVGRGRLVAAYGANVTFNGSRDLLSPEITRIAIPDIKKAIYGKAAMQYLKNQGVYDAVQQKLMIVATVPQAASYVISGEVDVALINVTHAQKIEKRIGGFTVLEEAAYSPIRIIVGMLDTGDKKPDCRNFLSFLGTQEAKAIVQRHGI
jgi:molybdate transport system substrate-binding protein